MSQRYCWLLTQLSGVSSETYIHSHTHRHTHISHDMCMYTSHDSPIKQVVQRWVRGCGWEYSKRCFPFENKLVTVDLRRRAEGSCVWREDQTWVIILTHSSRVGKNALIWQLPLRALTVYTSGPLKNEGCPSEFTSESQSERKWGPVKGIKGIVHPRKEISAIYCSPLWWQIHITILEIDGQKEFNPVNEYGCSIRQRKTTTEQIWNVSPSCSHAVIQVSERCCSAINFKTTKLTPCFEPK